MVRTRRPSRSARDVALVAACRGRHPRYAGLLPDAALDELTAVLRGAGRLGPLLERWTRCGLMHSLFDRQERWVLPGISASLLVRKRWIDEQARAAIHAGARQLVVLGAGFDPLAARLLRDHPGLCAFEVDHPPTQEQKRRGLAAAFPPEARPQLVPLDLQVGSLRAALEGADGFEPGVRSVFVAEGLLMYLEPPSARELLRTFAELCAPASRFVLTYVERDELGRARFGPRPGFLRWRARAAGEPMRWAIAPEELAGFLAPLGLALRTAPTPEALAAQFLAGHDHPLVRLGLGERFAVAERA